MLGISIIMVIIGVVGIISYMFKAHSDGYCNARKEILEKLYKDGKIDADTFLKYSKDE